MNDLLVVIAATGFLALIVYGLRQSQKTVSVGAVSPTDNSATNRSQLEGTLNQAHKIVSAYGAVLEQEDDPGIMFHPLSALPYTKVEIRGAIELLLLAERDDMKRSTLEVCDMFLNQFIPDEEYRIVRQQRSGLSQVMKCLQEGERDARKLAELALATGTSGTIEGEARLRHIEERSKQEDQLTLKRHQELKQESARIWSLQGTTSSDKPENTHRPSDLMK